MALSTQEQIDALHLRISAAEHSTDYQAGSRRVVRDLRAMYERLTLLEDRLYCEQGAGAGVSLANLSLSREVG
jgi:hypothetical protein